MSEVRFNFVRKTIPDKILFARNVVKKMGLAATTFAAPNPALTTIDNATDDLETACNNAADGGKALKAIMHSKEAILVGLMKTEAAYVQQTSKGDALIIDRSGFGTKASRHPIGEPEMVHNLVAKRSDISGQLDLSWTHVKGAKAYKVEQTLTPTTTNSWTLIGISTKGKFTITGLTSGQVFWFRVSAVGTAGLGPYSDPAKQMVG